MFDAYIHIFIISVIEDETQKEREREREREQTQGRIRNTEYIMRCSLNSREEKTANAH